MPLRLPLVRAYTRQRLFTLLLLGLVVPGLLMVHPIHNWYLKSVSQSHLQIAMVTGQYLAEYESLCERNTPHNAIRDAQHNQLPLCPCLPTNPIGRFNVDAWYKHLTEPTVEVSEESQESESEPPAILPPAIPVEEGGHWEPTGCQARQRVAILVPFRNRHEHLHVFTQYMHSFLQRQHLDYTIFVIEQSSPEIFNRAALMNIGFLEVNRVSPAGFDCYIFHDVDLLPEDDRNMYTCYMSPVHLGAYMNKFKYQMPYPGFFGGAIGLSGAHVRGINGFPNKYYGWGGEDDETYSRVQLENLTVNRYPQVVGQSFMFKHEADEDNPLNPLRDTGRLVKDHAEFQKVGLSSVRYEVTKLTRADTYTTVTVAIKPEYYPNCIINKDLPATSAKNYVNCLTKDNFRDGTIECCSKNHVTYCCDNGVLLRWYLQLILLCTVLITAVVSLVYIRRKKHSRSARSRIIL